VGGPVWPAGLLEANLSNARVQGALPAIDRLFWKEDTVQNRELSPWSVRWSLLPPNDSWMP
jgi:hypothetical protein